MTEDTIIHRIKKMVETHDTIPQQLKDELILLGLLEVLNTVTNHTTRLEFLENYKPYLQALAWAVGIIAAALVMMVITGKMLITIVP